MQIFGLNRQVDVGGRKGGWENITNIINDQLLWNTEENLFSAGW